jgi:hypothetical protein
MRRDDVWARAWCAVASGWNTKAPDATRYADICLKEFDERFPAPKPLETQYCGTPLSELTDAERIELRRTLANVPVRATDCGESCAMCCGPVDADGMTLAAIATGARSAETNEDLAQSEGRQSSGEAVSPNPDCDPGPPGVRS